MDTNGTNDHEFFEADSKCGAGDSTPRHEGTTIESFVPWCLGDLVIKICIRHRERRFIALLQINHLIKQAALPCATAGELVRTEPLLQH
jgi:hypothetical protein